MDPAITESLKTPAVRKSVIRMCRAVWKECPQSAPETYREKVEDLFRGFGR